MIIIISRVVKYKHKQLRKWLVSSKYKKLPSEEVVFASYDFIAIISNNSIIRKQITCFISL